MVTIMIRIFANEALMTSLAAWFTAQLLKVAFVYYKDRRIDFTRFIGSGGMPSSHSAFVVALTIAVGEQTGLDSPLFAVSAVLAFIVMYDAAGVRRAAGKQAKVLNTIIKDMHDIGKIPEEKLKELIGHTPVEVIGGAIVGILIAVIIH